MNPPSKLVLLVEDDLLLQQALEKFLGIHGFTVVTVTTANEALAVIRESALAAAIVDLNLPQGNGRDVVAAVPQPVPVIIFSGVPKQAAGIDKTRPNTRLFAKPYSLMLLV